MTKEFRGVFEVQTKM